MIIKVVCCTLHCVWAINLKCSPNNKTFSYKDAQKIVFDNIMLRNSQDTYLKELAIQGLDYFYIYHFISNGLLDPSPQCTGRQCSPLR